MSQTLRILIALFVGLVMGMIGARLGWQAAVPTFEIIGAMWLNALKMTIIPLIIALLITGIGRTAEAARGGGLAGRSVTTYLILITLSALSAAIVLPLILSFWPMPGEAAAALKSSIASQAGDPITAPSISDFFKDLIPDNPIQAAADTAMLPLIIFTLLFAFAVTMIDAAHRERIIGFFEAIEKTMLVMVHWVLWIAPIGVGALAFVVGVNAGTSAFGALIHYIVTYSLVGVVVWAFAYPMAVIGGRKKLGDFVRAIAPAQAVGFSTQSSLASLPAMLESSQKLGIPLDKASVSLPIAVTIFRATGPAMNLAVAIYVAHWMGIELSFWHLMAGFAVAAATAPAAVSLPGQVSFFTSCAPICVAMGLPVEPLAILVAVEMIPDLVRTVGNVTWDVAATSFIARDKSGVSASETAETV